jgi:hypothetical protein
VENGSFGTSGNILALTPDGGGYSKFFDSASYCVVGNSGSLVDVNNAMQDYTINR